MPMSIFFGTREMSFAVCIGAAHKRIIQTATSRARFNYRKLFGEAAFIMLFTLLTQVSHGKPPLSEIDDVRLPDLPDPLGFAAPFVGVAGDALIVAGGTNFPDAPPWNNGTKTWHDVAFVLPSAGGEWRKGFKLPRRVAYGIALTTKSGVVCIGG